MGRNGDFQKVEKLEHEVQELSREELSVFRDWFSKYDSDEWDRQIEKDIRAGKLESLAEAPLQITKPEGQEKFEVFCLTRFLDWDSVGI